MSFAQKMLEWLERILVAAEFESVIYKKLFTMLLRNRAKTAYNSEVCLCLQIEQNKLILFSPNEYGALIWWRTMNTF